MTQNTQTWMWTIGISFIVFAIFSCSDSGNNPADVDITLPDSNLAYIEDIRPFFISKCASRSGCHSFSDQAGGLDLTDYQSILSHIVFTNFGNEQLVIPGDGLNSFLYKILMDNEGGRPRMPLDGPPYLNQNNTNGVRIWIDEGVRFSRE